MKGAYLLEFLLKSIWHPTPVLLPGKSHGRRSLVGCSPWGRKESDTTEQLHFHFSLSCIGEGNGSNPLQCSCLENPRDRGAWWAVVYGVAQSRTRLKRLSNSSSIGKVRPEMETLFAQDSHSQKVVKGHSNSFSLSTHPMHWPTRQLRYTHPVLLGLVGRKRCFVLHFKHHLIRAREVIRHCPNGRNGVDKFVPDKNGECD